MTPGEWWDKDQYEQTQTAQSQFKTKFDEIDEDMQLIRIRVDQNQQEYMQLIENSNGYSKEN